MSLVLRAQSDPLSLVDAVRGQIRAVDDELPVYRVKTAEQYVTQSVARPRFHMLLIGAFAAIALLLAVVGIYGLMSYSVGQRTHEVGVRMALGAHAGDVVRLILRECAGLTLIGVGFGLVAAFALTRVLESSIYGVSTTDSMTFIGGATVLAIVAMVATYIPARRATRVDPLEALRHE
jgi:putative ABC transport system permease protein